MPRSLSLALMLAGILLGGCADAPPAADAPRLAITLHADARLNPDSTGRPAPVEIRLFELASADRFQRAGFLELYRNAATVLGDKTPAPIEATLRPGQTRQLSPSLVPGTRLLAVVVYFRNFTQSRWRALAPVDPADPPRIAVTVSADRVDLTAQPAPRPGFWQRLTAPFHH